MYDTNSVGSTVTSRVAELLRKDIYSKNIEAGTHISIQEIADKYGISKTPVREAFRTLEGEKLLEFSAHRGATVIGVDKTYISEIYEIVLILESYLTESALPFVDEESLGNLRRINGMIREIAEGTRPYDQFSELNWQFHQVIMCKGTNSVAHDLHDTYSRQIKALRNNYQPNPTRVSSIVKEHDDIIKAFEEKNPTALQTGASKHASSAKANFLEQYETENAR